MLKRLPDSKLHVIRKHVKQMKLQLKLLKMKLKQLRSTNKHKNLRIVKRKLKWKQVDLLKKKRNSRRKKNFKKDKLIVTPPLNFLVSMSKHLPKQLNRRWRTKINLELFFLKTLKQFVKPLYYKTLMQLKKKSKMIMKTMKISMLKVLRKRIILKLLRLKLREQKLKELRLKD